MIGGLFVLRIPLGWISNLAKARHFNGDRVDFLGLAWRTFLSSGNIHEHCLSPAFGSGSASPRFASTTIWPGCMYV